MELEIPPLLPLPVLGIAHMTMVIAHDSYSSGAFLNNVVARLFDVLCY